MKKITFLQLLSFLISVSLLLGALVSCNSINQQQTEEPEDTVSLPDSEESDDAPVNEESDEEESEEGTEDTTDQEPTTEPEDEPSGEESTDQEPPKEDTDEEETDIQEPSTPPEEPTEETTGLDFTNVEPIQHTSLTANYTYFIGDGNTLTKYMNKTRNDFLGVCKYFANDGYELYGYNEMGNLVSATYTKSGLMMHVYWIGGEMNELAVVRGWVYNTLPPATPEITTGQKDTVIVQMRANEADLDTQINGMGYVIRLADGSFIIYDGGYASRVDELWDTLTSLNGGNRKIIIRAWLITHSHGDHTGCFDAFSQKYASKVTLERLLVSPINKDIDWYRVRLNRFRRTSLICVHTGMVFTFCDVKMEILCSADEIYFDGASNDFNNTSIVSRIYKDGGKKVMILGDAGDDVSNRLIPMYGDYLKSDICQAAHHGVEDFTIEAYRLIRASVWFYPCNSALYASPRHIEVRKEIEHAEYTKRIFLHDAPRRTEISINK